MAPGVDRHRWPDDRAMGQWVTQDVAQASSEPCLGANGAGFFCVFTCFVLFKTNSLESREIKGTVCLPGRFCTYCLG